MRQARTCAGCDCKRTSTPSRRNSRVAVLNSYRPNRKRSDSMLLITNCRTISRQLTAHPEVQTYEGVGATMGGPIETTNSRVGSCSIGCSQILIGSVDPDA